MRALLSGLIAAAAFGAAVAGSAATAQVSTQPLAPGEVLLEVTSLGVGSTPADSASLTANVTGSGADDAAAERALEAAEARARRAAEAAGVEAGDITSTETVLTMDVAADALPADLATEQAQPQNVIRRRTLELRLRDLSRVGAVRDALRDAGAAAVSDANYAVSDNRPAARAARANALAAAREQAETYAASLGMRVVRIVRVTERVGMDMFTIFATDPSLAQRLQPNRANTDPQVESYAFVGVDFALAPR